MIRTQKVIRHGDQIITLTITDPDGYIQRVIKNVLSFEDALDHLDVRVSKIERATPRLNQRIEKPINHLPEILVLFLKKSTSSTLIDHIIRDKHLPVGVENDLFVNTLKMWAGSEKDYLSSGIPNEFTKPEYTDSFAKEYDYVALRFRLAGNYSGYKKNEASYERNMFFKSICSKQLELIQYSKTLSFDNGIPSEVYDV